MARPKKDLQLKPAKERLLEAAFKLVRERGYSSSSVEELCELAGVTKGTFFHYFESKEALAVEAAKHWSLVTGKVFASAEYRKMKDPRERLLGYIQFRKDLIQGTPAQFTCFVGTLAQEVFETSASIRKACGDSILDHVDAYLEQDIVAAKKLYAPNERWSPKSLALYTQAVIQGAFVLVKATQDPAVALQSLDHLKRYFEQLFGYKPKIRRSL